MQEREEEKSEAESFKTDEMEEDTFGKAAKQQITSHRDTHKFVNKDLQQKTEELQEEFEKILGELNNRRATQDREVFYTALNEYYKEGAETHSSPVRRLIQHKNTAFDHKKTMKETIQKGDYAFVYVPGPEKSYVIEPHGGSLNYNIVNKDPNKFYDQVFNQDLTKHTVAKDKEAMQKIEEEQKQRKAEGKAPLRKA